MRVDVHELRTLDEGLHVVDADAYGSGLHVRLRMTVVELPEGLWLCSPVPIDDALAARLAELGEVAYVVAPNLGHHLFLVAARERYPDAQIWAAPGFLEQHPDLRPFAEMEDGQRFGDAIEAIKVDGARFANEVVFFHAPTRTMIVTDLVQNVREEPQLLTRLVYHGLGVMGRLAVNRRFRWLAWPAIFGASVERLLAREPERLIMAHGDVVETDATERLREAMAWVLKRRGR